MKNKMTNNFLEYIDYYKDNTFDEIHFNMIDAALLAFLSYEPCFDIKDDSTFEDLYNACLKMDEKDIHGAMAYINIDMLNVLKDVKRYKDIKVYNVQKQVDSDIQFGAVTFRWNNVAYVSFEGTSASMAGWVENFNLYAEYPTDTQKMAIDYLNNTIKDEDEIIYVGGHSKGGNLAMCASMETSNSIFNRIEKIYNLDGPGFREEEFNSDKYNKMHEKCINLLPDGSMVGILLNNKDYIFIEAQDIGFKKHYPFNWKMFGEFFKKGEQDKFSKGMQLQLSSNLDKVDMNDYKKLLSAFKNFFKENNLVTSRDLDDMTFIKMKDMFDDVKDVDPETRKRFFEMIKVLFIRDK